MTNRSWMLVGAFIGSVLTCSRFLPIQWAQPPQGVLLAGQEPSVAPSLNVSESDATELSRDHEPPVELLLAQSELKEDRAKLPETVEAEPKAPARSVDLGRIDQLIASDSVIDAHRELSAIYWKNPAQRAAIQSRLERTAQLIYFSPQPHFLDPYVIQSGDRLQTIAAKHKLDWHYLASLNKVDPKRIRAGQKLKVITGPFSVDVDLSDFELTVHAHGFFVKRYPVGVGKEGASPQGKFTVLEKLEKAQYTDPKGKVIAGGHPTNPLGTHWIDIGESFGIHGTIEPDSIGKAESRGCIRMRNEDVAEVYNFLIKGSEVVIRQ